MSLLQEWRDKAYSQENDAKKERMFWDRYFEIEKGIYEKLLTQPITIVEGTVEELAQKYETDVQTMVGFLDGINDSLKNPNPIEEMNEDTTIIIDIELELLYKNMVEANADWLYELKEWESLILPERRKELFLIQKKSNTVVKGEKIGRNDPCPCNSGKKYKKCCGK